jgi:hypothetical protein
LINRNLNRITEKAWVQQKHGPLSNIWTFVKRYWYRVVPATLSTSITVGGMLTGLVQLVLLSLLTFTPILFAKFVAPRLSVSPKDIDTISTLAVYQTLLLLTVQFLKFAFDKLNTASAARAEQAQSLSEMSVALSQVIGILREQIQSFSATPEAAAKRDQFLGSALKCIEATVRLYTGNMDIRYCCVSLLTFEAGGMVRVRARSTAAGRLIGGTYPRDPTMVYSVARYAKQSFNVRHFKAAAKVNKANPLEYRALSTPQRPPYESILLLPLPAATIPGQTRAIRKGVVTIDAARPYEFFGKEAAILTRVQAYLDLINLMLTNHAEGIEPEF